MTKKQQITSVMRELSWIPSGTQTPFSGDYKIFYVLLLQIKNSNRRFGFKK